MPPRVPKGLIVLIDFPFTDLSDSKLRPALVLHEGYQDVLVACISSSIPKTLLKSDILINIGTSSFIKAGLKKRDAVLLIDKMATLKKESIAGILGEADEKLKQQVNERITQCLMFS